MNNNINFYYKKGSVRNIFLIILSTIIVVASFAFAEYKNSKEVKEYSSVEIDSAKSLNVDAQNLDTDGDGLKDWEELLVGSDPRNPESKSSAPKKTLANKDITVKKEPLNATDALGREFFTRYMELRQMGNSSDKLSQQEAVNETINSLNSPSKAKVYKLSDIKTIEDSSVESIRKYANSIGQIFRTYSVVSRNESVILKDALEKQDQDILNELDPIISAYKKILSESLKVYAPSSIKQLHLDLINSISNMIYLNEQYKSAFIDPLSAIRAISDYLKYAKDFASSFNAIKSYITYLGITYTDQEGGSFFQNIK